MGKVQAYSSVSVVDLTDVGSINLYCTSNQPTTVIYNPNQNIYTPNWSSSPYLKITPVISYNGTNLSLTASGLSITFKRKEGSGTATTLTTGESVSSGVLTVNANKLSSVSSGLLTYICTITYTDPDTGVPISAEASMSYSLVSQASELHYATILGEGVFLYDTNRSIVGANQITLTADLTNVSVTQWQYKKSDGTFAAYPTTAGINSSNTGSTLVVDESESGIWINGKNAVIKLVTSDNSVYDLHDIVKIYDGAAGNSTVSAVLSNENHYLPCSSDGTVKSWNGAATDIHIYEGGTDVTSSWSISVTNGSGLSGTYNSNNYTYTPSALTVDSSYADFTCTRSGYSNIVKRYTITKQTAGLDGNDAVVYDVIPSSYAMNLSEAGVFTPTSVTFSAYQKVGNANRTNYSGRFVISESTNGGSTFTAVYTSGSNESSKVYTPSANTVDAIKCVLYKAGGTSVELDSQTVVVTRDGNKGQNGTNGTDGLSVGLANYSDVIPCNTSGNASAARDISIPFYAYKGITRVAVTATPGTLPTGVTVKSNTAGTTSANGLLILTVASGATMGSSSLMSGDITITLAAQGQSFDQKYSWTKSKQASNGTSAVILQLYSEDGGNVETGKNTTIKTLLTSGTSTVTSGVTYAWAEFKNGSYQTISGQTGANITITPAMVTDQMWLRCTATYSSKSYNAYYTIDDTTDPYTAYTYATVSEFKNSQGYGAIYTRVYQNGVEVDVLKSTVFSNTAPSNPSSGDFYYHLDPNNKTCVLKKYNGSSWANATETDAFTYKYYRIDNKGTALDTTDAYKDTRCFYVDPSIINGRMQFICEISD